MGCEAPTIYGHPCDDSIMKFRKFIVSALVISCCVPMLYTPSYKHFTPDILCASHGQLLILNQKVFIH